MSVPLFNTEAPLLAVKDRITERVAQVLAAGQFILGPEVQAFEREFADYLGVRHVIGVANGTDAITIALRALGVRPGDEVVVPSLTFYASAEAVVNAGARLGVAVIVNSGAIVEHDCIIGDHAHIATGARLASTVDVGALAHIGAGATIRQTITIGATAAIPIAPTMDRHAPARVSDPAALN